MAAKRSFICQACGAVHPRWQGQCDSCSAWNTLMEEALSAPIAGSSATTSRAGKGGRVFALESLQCEGAEAPRFTTGISELDRVTGGGFVPASVLLLGGEPGIGKSTLTLEACAALANSGARVAYITGEEAMAQVRLRARRLGLADAPVELAAETSVEDILATLRHGKTPNLIIIDSIQTMWSQTVESAPGSVTQVRGAAQILIRFAKSSGAVLLLVGHVTKDGQIAGPRVVEHMVDTVLSFETDAGGQYRILRALKNRFGPANEIGVFEMTGTGLREIKNPSALFLSGRDTHAPGSAVFAGMEGTRPLLVEIQALVSPSSLSNPRRSVVGWDNNRLAMVLAVLETHGGVRMSNQDIYLNVAGGLKISETAADLAAAAALISSLSGSVLPATDIYFGELALSGAIRPVAHGRARLREAVKLGFLQANTPALFAPLVETTDKAISGKTTHHRENIESALLLRPVAHIADLVSAIVTGAKKKPSPSRNKTMP